MPRLDDVFVCVLTLLALLSVLYVFANIKEPIVTYKGTFECYVEHHGPDSESKNHPYGFYFANCGKYGYWKHNIGKDGKMVGRWYKWMRDTE